MTWLVSDCTVNYRPVFSSEKPSKEEKSNCQTKKEEQDKNLVKGPKGRPDTQTHWSTDCRPQEELQLQHNEAVSREMKWNVQMMNNGDL
jgi:hypothetical protein